MKKTNILGLSFVSILALTACGGSTASSPSIETGVGYYKDAAVIGADYDCGVSKGKTEAEGKFLFEKGQSCIFSLAGVKLREVPASDLLDEETIFEDNLVVAKFLQAIDKDGEPSNGIVLDEEVVKALVAALEDANKTAELPTGAELASVVAHIGQEVTTFTGRVRTDTEVLAHLDRTETELSKALFSGKTFYAYALDDNGKHQITEVIVSEDASSWNYTDLVGGSGNGHENITFKKDTISIEHAGEQELDSYRIDKKDTYLALKKGEKEELKFFYKKADAQAYSGLIKGETTSNSSLSYTIYGGNTYFYGGFGAMPNSYSRIGEGKSTKTFYAQYKYYVVANENRNVTIYIDAIKGDDDTYYSANTTSNTGDTWQNLSGIPDQKYVSIRAHGYILIDASETTLNSIEVFTK